MIEFSIHYPIGRVVTEPGSDKVRVEFVLPKRPFLFWGSKLILGYPLDIPKGYGVAWYDWAHPRALYAPLPFNVLISLGIWVWFWVRFRLAYKLARQFRVKLRETTDETIDETKQLL